MHQERNAGDQFRVAPSTGAPETASSAFSTAMTSLPRLSTAVVDLDEVYRKIANEATAARRLRETHG